ncbi:hypothetical protein OM076_27280 [Solirubrobacter ginsenosidimutans]|uniref:CU044_5270 family protein n=1 Tax=Solirubrobacter ginsenosidimutans TaxID=490573 RepID=A0A9X3MWK1_9ACTN|nr:hypothetical protein [Solirubrobacter ginsenosidimutans]MDA0164005.1 hypothetical protein [Solirubrobacter ginsenosidimutans]
MIDELLAPLAPQEPGDAEIRALLARADRRTKRRRIKIAGATAFAAVAVTATLAALPSDPKAPRTAHSILTTSAALAADQPSPGAWTGYRYVREVELRDGDGYTVERSEESWVSSDWMGRRVSPEAKVVSGTIPPEHKAPPLPAAIRKEIDRNPAQLSPEALAALRNAASVAKPDPKTVLAGRTLEAPGGMPNLYGDGALYKVPLDQLPTDPEQLGTLLLQAHKDGRWTPGGSWDPLSSGVKYDVLRDLLVLLTDANATSQQRAAMITVLTEYEGSTPLESVKDHRGREGRGVDIPTGRATVRVIFSPDTSELLEWSEPGEVHTYLQFGHVASIGERP